MDQRAIGSVTLHSSWLGLVLGLFGSGAVVVAGVASLVLTSGAIGSWLLFVVGAAMLGVVLFDFPLACAFDGEGATRRSILRRQRVGWDRVDQITRARPTVIALKKSLTPGGLTAKVGRRRYLLVDQCESLDEFDRLVDVLDELSDALGVEELIPPPVGVDPTWTYRRAKWQPDPS